MQMCQVLRRVIPGRAHPVRPLGGPTAGSGASPETRGHAPLKRGLRSRFAAEPVIGPAKGRTPVAAPRNDRDMCATRLWESEA